MERELRERRNGDVVYSGKSTYELTLGAHAQRGFTVCLSVTTFYATTRKKSAKQR